MVLVDTSVLINFLQGNGNDKTKKLEYLIEKNIPYGISSYTYMELLQGIRDDKQFALVKEYLSSHRFYELKNGHESYAAAAELYRRCRKKGITVRSTIDLLIVQVCLENELYLLHDDRDFANIAEVIEGLLEY